MEYHKINQSDIENLEKLLAKEQVLSSSRITEEYSHDEMEQYGKFTPEAVVLAYTTEDVSKVMKYCYQNNIAITPRGAGTGLCGGCVCTHGGICLSLDKMNSIIEIDEVNMLAIIEPGVRLMTLIAEVDKHNMLYAPDPGEKSATVGGNVMTNAGGMRAIKYGVTRDYVKGMEVVTAQGDILQLGGKVAKNSSGYSLKDVLIGSEGTLAIVTKLYLKLLPKPKKMISLLVPFNDLKDCLAAVNKVRMLPNQPTTLEFCEKEVINDATEYLGKQFPSKEYNCYLIVSYSGNSNDELEKVYSECSELLLESNAVDVLISDTSERQDSIWTARGAFLEAIKNSTGLMDECDVVVPISEIYTYLQFIKELSSQQNIRIRSFGHAGDGNLHVYVCKDQLDDTIWEEKRKICMDSMYQKASELNGFTSGEHGIGHAKVEYLAERVGNTQLEIMRGIKDAFDPKHILNPGKVFK